MGPTFQRLLVVLLLVTLALFATDAANPLSKFLMMKNRKKEAMSSSSTVSDAESCDDALHQAADALEAAENARETAVQDKDAALSKVSHLQKMMDDMRQDFDAKMKRLTEKDGSGDRKRSNLFTREQFDSALKDMSDSHAKVVAEVKTLAETKEQELATVIDDLKEQLANETGQIEKVKLKYMTLMDKGIKETEEKWQYGLQSIEKQSKMYLGQIEGELKQKCLDETRALKKEHSEAVSVIEGEKAELVQQLDALKLSSLEMEESSERQVQDMRELHETVVKGLRTELQTTASSQARLEDENRDLRLDLSIYEKELEKTYKQMEYWKDVYDRRPYCNVTHVREDFAKFYATAVRATSGKLRDGRTTGANFVHQTTEKVSTTVAPVTQAISEKIISPVAQKARPATTSVVNAVKGASSYVFSKLVSFFQSSCPGHLSTLKEMKENRGIPVPDAVLENLQHNCENPEEAVSTLLIASLVLVGIIFIGPRISNWFFKRRRQPTENLSQNGKRKGKNGKK